MRRDFQRNASKIIVKLLFMQGRLHRNIYICVSLSLCIVYASGYVFSFICICVNEYTINQTEEFALLFSSSPSSVPTFAVVFLWNSFGEGAPVSENDE